jgi:hypothetical protein
MFDTTLFIKQIKKTGDVYSDLSHVIWLEGMRFLTQDVFLYPQLVDDYLDRRHFQFDYFDPMIMHNTLLDLQDELSQGIIRPVCLPVNDKMHLSFLLEKNSLGLEQFVFADYKIDYGKSDFEIYCSPRMTLDLSEDFSSDPILESRISKGELVYDTNIKIHKRTPKEIYQTYDSLAGLLLFARKPDKQGMA